MLRKSLPLDSEALCSHLTVPGDTKQEGRGKGYKFVIILLTRNIVLESPKLGTSFTDFFSKSMCDAQKRNSFLLDSDDYDVWCTNIHMFMFVCLRQGGE